MTDPATRRRKIKEATKAARERMNQRDDQALRRVRERYEEALGDIQRRLPDDLPSGELRQSDLEKVLPTVRSRIERITSQIEEDLESFAEQAARIGAEAFTDEASSGAVNRAWERASRYIWEFEDEDGLQLSDRLWRLEEGAKEVMSENLERAVREGQDASQAAAEYLEQDRDIPEHIRRRRARGTLDGLVAEAERSMMTGRMNPYQQARRVMRTELNRTWNEAYEDAAFEAPDVVGTRFLLSPEHPETDICDMHATANLYGMGPGVYPKGKNPLPAHPNTLSYKEAVFEDELPDAGDDAREDRLGWVRRQDPETQERVLNSKAKKRAMDRGLLESDDVPKPWKAVRRRLARDGVDVEELEQ